MKLNNSLSLFSVLILFVMGCGKEDTMTPPCDFCSVECPELCVPPVRYLDRGFDVGNSNSVAYARDQSNHRLDYWYPQDDSLTSRPLVLLAMGGGWRHLSADNMKPALATYLAGRGYSVAVMGYRVATDGAIDDFNDLSERIVDAMHDINAAVRYFKEHHDSYGIDTTQIFVGGWSAGAMTSLFTGYLDPEDEMSPLWDHFNEYMELNGGIEGNQGNEGHTSRDIKGIISIAGAVGFNYFDEGEPSLLLLHGTNDGLVQIDSNYSQDYDFWSYGSLGMIQFTDRANLDETSFIIEGGNHSDPMNNEYFVVYRDWLYEHLD